MKLKPMLKILGILVVVGFAVLAVIKLIEKKREDAETLETSAE